MKKLWGVIKYIGFIILLIGILSSVLMMMHLKRPPMTVKAPVYNQMVVFRFELRYDMIEETAREWPTWTPDWQKKEWFIDAVHNGRYTDVRTWWRGGTVNIPKLPKEVGAVYITAMTTKDGPILWSWSWEDRSIFDYFFHKFLDWVFPR